jgi:hypothetical protein
VITIFGNAFVVASLATPTVKSNGADKEGLPVKLLPDNAGFPEKRPCGNVIVIMLFATKAFVTFKDIVKVPPLAFVHAAVPLNPGILGIHFFAAAFQVVPTSQQPGP